MGGAFEPFEPALKTGIECVDTAHSFGSTCCVMLSL